jgi:hypothetical protein
MASAGDPAQDAAKHEQARPEGETHGSTPPHGDPLEPEHRQTGGPHEDGAPEAESDSATGPHGDPLAG